MHGGYPACPQSIEDRVKGIPLVAGRKADSAAIEKHEEMNALACEIIFI
jgi:hypothetical protein